MRKLRSLWPAVSSLVWIVAASMPRAEAQSMLQSLGTDLKSSAGDAWDVWTSPLRGRGRDWIAAAGTIAAAAAVSRVDDNIDRWAVRHEHDDTFDFLSPVRAGGELYSGRTITPIALSVVALGLVSGNRPLQDGLFGCATAYGSSSVARSFVMYPLVARTRPDPRPSGGPPPAAVQGDQYHFAFPGKGSWGEHSFPGGHLANISACASFLTERFSLGVAEPMIWAVVGGVALGRTLDRGHWASDEVVGAVFGYAVGKQVALRSLRRARRAAEENGAAAPSAFFVSPAPSGLAVGWKRVF